MTEPTTDRAMDDLRRDLERQDCTCMFHDSGPLPGHRADCAKVVASRALAALDAAEQSNVDLTTERDMEHAYRQDLESERAALVEAVESSGRRWYGRRCWCRHRSQADTHTSECVTLRDILADLSAAAKEHDAREQAKGAEQEWERLRVSVGNEKRAAFDREQHQTPLTFERGVSAGRVSALDHVLALLSSEAPKDSFPGEVGTANVYMLGWRAGCPEGRRDR